MSIPDRHLLLRQADQCVMCGMCLPHCPTYLKTRNEAESPRGRISLMQGMLNGRLELTPRLKSHLDTCLSCRACEAVCPSGVSYGSLINGARAVIASRQADRKLRQRLLDQLIFSRTRRRFAGRMLRLYQGSGLGWLARRSGALKLLGLNRLEAMLPALAPQGGWSAHYPAQGQARGNVALFTGCMSELFDRQVLNAALKLLTLTGYNVHLPAQQTCCGAIHQHRGDAASADSLAAANRLAFSNPDLAAIITVASGCAVTLSESLASLPAPVMDVSQFLARNDWLAQVSFAPLHQRVAVHDPCSLTHVLHQQDKPYALLSRIPGLELQALAQNSRCCGGAGSYMLEQEEMAQQLREDKIAALRASGAHILLTSNTGCSIHLRAGILAAKLDVAVMHPVELLVRQLKLPVS